MRQVRVTETEPGSSAAAGPPHAADVVEHALGNHDVLVTEVLVSGQTALNKPVQGAEALNKRLVSQCRKPAHLSVPQSPCNLTKN